MHFRSYPALATSIALAIACTHACAHDGDLDLSFGTDGLTVIGFGVSAEGWGLDIASDGRVVLGGIARSGATGTDFAAARLTPDGQTDNSFHLTGQVIIPVGSGAAFDFSFDTLVQSNGKIVLAGYGPPSAIPGVPSDFKLVRLNTNGELDTTFSGDGKAAVQFDLGGQNNDRAFAVAQLANGKLIAVGDAEVTGEGTDFAIVQLNVDGSLDTSFSGDGRATVQFNLDPTHRNESATAVAIDAVGNIIVAGAADAASGQDFAIARLRPNGSLDTAFGSGGRVVVSFDSSSGSTSLVVAPDGSIFVTGLVNTGSYDFGAVKLQPNGAIDTAFGSNGKAIVSFDLGDANNDLAYGAALQPDGKLVLCGLVSVSATNADVALARLNADGNLDEKFGFLGKKTIAPDIGGDFFDGATRCRVQGGYLVFSGAAQTAPGIASFLSGRVIIDTIFDDGFELD